ncbi:MAG TPA: methionine ABC transporter permease [Feifaniaceae bacterium]|nr:methionine ABC transporter permease [Feifaniaceae bacterium]
MYMVLTSTVLAYALGLPLGIVLVVTARGGIRPAHWLYKALDIFINIVRSLPFLILLLAVSPITRFITGTTIGSEATVVPLVISAAPFIARLVESSFKEVDRGVVEAAQSMGASPSQIIFKVLLAEAKPSLLVGGAIAITTILGYSAMAGFVGGGGLGDIAIRYGYNRYQTDIMLVTAALLVALVQIFQEVGMKIARRSDKRKS